MDESRYQELTDAAFRRIEDALDAHDAESVDYDRAGDVITIAFSSGKKCVVNTQRPTRQIWLAADARAWHFSWDGARWLCDKGTGDELHGTLAAIVARLSAP